MSGARQLSAAVVIVTYERAEVLRHTMECWRRVVPGPDQFVIVDASARASEERASVLCEYADLFASPGSDYVVAAQPSITAQRNQGLQLVETDVVLFTDDESRPESDYVAKILEVYERDSEGLIGGVGGSERDEETMPARAPLWVQNTGRLVARRFAEPRRWPRRSDRRLRQEMVGLPIVTVRRLHGAKMSFRADLAKRLGFDTHMMRYAYCEDLDISIRAGATHLLVQRKDAFVTHDEAELGRVPGHAAFLASWVNPAYLTEKLGSPRPRRGPLRRLLYATAARELLRPSTIRRRQRRKAELDRFALAKRMITYLRTGPPGQLTRRFDALQRYVFEVSTAFDGSDAARFDQWLAAVGDREDASTLYGS